MLAPIFLNAEKYAGEIFYMSPGVSNQAMGNTGLTNDEAVSAAWWNPALLALTGSRGVELMHAEQFDGLMQFNHFSAILGSQNRFGFVISHIGIDDIALTKLENDSLPPSANNRPFAWKRVNNNDLTAYFGISRSVKEHLHLGITPKLAYRSMAEKTGYGFGADLGMLWDINEAFRLGLVARDFFSTQVIWENGTQENVLPSANMEVGLRTSVTKREIPLHLALGIETMMEGREEASTISAGEFSADIHAGMAISPIPQLKVMAGYDVDAVTTGLAIQIKNLFIDYAIKLGSQDDLGYSQRVSAGWRW
jgi:hypothetical protein